MTALKKITSIENVLSGLPAMHGLGFSPFAKQPPPAPPPIVKKTITKAPAGPTNVQLPFYADTRRFQPSSQQVFEHEQAAAKRYREENAPPLIEAPEGYSQPTDEYFSPTGSPQDMAVPLKQVATSQKHAARIQFVDWLKTSDPTLYAAMVQKLGGQLGATDSQPDATATAAPAPSVPLWQKIIGSVTELASGLIGASATKKVLDLNIKRAEQGLPPVDASTMAPVVKTQVQITPEMAADLKAGASKTALIAGAALGGIVLIMVLTKKHRR